MSYRAASSSTPPRAANPLNQNNNNQKPLPYYENIPIPAQHEDPILSTNITQPTLHSFYVEYNKVISLQSASIFSEMFFKFVIQVSTFPGVRIQFKKHSALLMVYMELIDMNTQHLHELTLTWAALGRKYTKLFCEPLEFEIQYITM